MNINYSFLKKMINKFGKVNPKPFEELFKTIKEQKNLIFIENKCSETLEKFIFKYERNICSLDILIDSYEKSLTYHWDKNSSSISDFDHEVRKKGKIAFIFCNEEYSSEYMSYPEKFELNYYPFLVSPLFRNFRKNIINESDLGLAIFCQIFNYFKYDIEKTKLQSIFFISNKSFSHVKQIINENKNVFYLKIEKNRVILLSNTKKIDYFLY